MDKNERLLKLIHHEMDDSCYAAILKQWSEDDYTKEELDVLKAKDLYKYCLLKNHEAGMFDRIEKQKGFFRIARRMMTEEKEDVYFSINSFWRENKSSEDVRHINAFILDFDFYKLDQYKELSPEGFYESVLKDRLPLPPTAVIDSGRGLYVLYVIKHCSYHMSKLYKEITKWMYQKLGGYGMDPKAMNITQVIRLPGSINSRSLREVQIIELMPDNLYKIQDLAVYLPYSLQEVKEHRKNRKNEDIKKIEEIKQKANFDRRKYYFRIFISDIKKLIKLRDTMEGFREYALYIIRERAEWSGYTIDESIRIAQQINQLFDVPLSEYDVEKTCKPSKGRYKTSLETIMFRLQISAEEMKGMQMLKTKNMKCRQRARKQRRHLLLNRTEKQIQIMERRKSVLYLKYEKGLKNKEIAEKLGVDKGLITRDLHYIRNNPSEFIKKIEIFLRELDAYSKTKEFKLKEVYKRQLQILQSIQEGFSVLANRSILRLIQDG